MTILIEKVFLTTPRPITPETVTEIDEPEKLIRTDPRKFSLGQVW